MNSLSCVFALEIQSQTQIEILNADKISFNSAIDENRQLLKGNVKTKDNDRYLTCDSAYFYAKENKIEAFSNIHIWQGDSLNLKGEYLIYYGNHQLAEIENNVHFTHNEMNLYSEKIKYIFETHIVCVSRPCVCVFHTRTSRNAPVPSYAPYPSLMPSGRPPHCRKRPAPPSCAR